MVGRKGKGQQLDGMKNEFGTLLTLSHAFPRTLLGYALSRT